jgi:hypothetical protein
MKRTPLRKVPIKKHRQLKDNAITIGKVIKKRKPSRDPLDDLFSEYIRRRAIQRVSGCERCLTPKHDTLKEDGTIFPAWKTLQCSHFNSRGDLSTRFDPDNAIGACGACHLFLEHHPHEHDRWFKEHLGQEKFDMLEGRNRVLEKPDRKLLEIYYKAKIKEMGG